MAASKPKPKYETFVVRKRSALRDAVTSPAGLGLVTSLGLTVAEKFGRSPLRVVLPQSLLNSRIPTPLLALLVGLPAGYIVSKSTEWLRWKALQGLLEYDGWVTNPKSNKTKLWGVLLKILSVTPDNTFTYQRYLPKQPLPDLENTLNLWLQVSSQFLTKDELEQTKDAVERFRQNEGPKLQDYLVTRSQKTVNWLYDYWMRAAYLSSRESIALDSNFYLVNKRPDNYEIDQLARSAGVIHTFLTLYELLQHNNLSPVQLQGLVPLCMNGYRYIFNSLREPGEQLDRIIRYPGETHIVIIRKGHYYQLDLFTADPSHKDKRRPLRPEEIRLQLERICEHAENQSAQLPVAALTTLNRTKWAKLREKLQEKNADTLRTLEGSMFVFSLDDQAPEDMNDHCKVSMTGRGNDRWFDKCFTGVSWPTAVYGCNVEHSGIDAMVFCTAVEHQMVAEPYENKDIVRTPEGPDKNLPPPILMTWDLDYMEKDITEAFDTYMKRASDVSIHVIHTDYGKGFMKKQRLSPDGYIQMAIQLAYYKLHKETTKTYEPSTGRLYALGRTENIHPVSMQSKAWVRSMSDPTSTQQSRRDLLVRAVHQQTKSRLDATVGQGCDRHLLGLYCASREMGMDVPSIFADKPWRSPFKLSTSQTPTRTIELGVDMDLKWVLGGFGAQCSDGYGISYVQMGENMFNMSVCTWNHCESTNAAKFGAAVLEALDEMKALFN